MGMTTAQRTRLLRKFGDPEQAVFTEPELDDIWDEVSSAKDDTTRYNASLYLMFESVLNSAQKLHDYSAGATDEKLNQVTKNLERRIKAYEAYYEAATSQQSEFARATLLKRPHQKRGRPSTEGGRATRYNNTLDDRDY